MILNELQNFLSQHKKASLADMQLHFRIDGNALRGMLSKLIRKGRVRKMEDGKKCGGCHSCDPSAIEFYEWLTLPDLKSQELLSSPKMDS
ncbi:FeoC-like transcriptional regulator [Anabaena sp. PCC 7108]|uniref:FeoC-like transcriptional regulator n=1 Tax=Anabaena sp. PCC 7108 TaxID=163908 RepID=UPI00034D7043|nr:FeoC-like transcriptional regulator [Anabaena sp. PCC 7108]